MGTDDFDLYCKAVKLLQTAAELLNEVHTGEDFEATCMTHASEIEDYLGTVPDDYMELIKKS